MATDCYAMVRGSVARFTLLDQRGSPVQGPSSVVVTKGILQVQINEVTEATSNDLRRTDFNEPRLLLRGRTNTIGYTADLSLTGVDPDLIWMLTGQPRVENAAGDVVGNDAELKLPVVNFAMEVWSKLSHPIDGYRYGYTLFPRLRCGRVSGFSFGNSAVNFSIAGARTTRSSKWGYGPYSLMWHGDGWDLSGWDSGPWDTPTANPHCSAESASVFDRLGSPVSRNLHWRNFLVDWTPSDHCGASTLYDSVDNGNALVSGEAVLDGQFVMTSEDITDGGQA